MRSTTDTMIARHRAAGTTPTMGEIHAANRADEIARRTAEMARTPESLLVEARARIAKLEAILAQVAEAEMVDGEMWGWMIGMSTVDAARAALAEVER